MSKKNILIVDDNPTTLKLLRLLMAAEGYEVQTASGSKDALTALYSFTPDVVLMDIQMPGMNGLQLTRLINLARGAKKIPVLAVSSDNTDASIEAARAAGCDGYITKPVDTKTFSTTIRDLLAARMARAFHAKP